MVSKVFSTLLNVELQVKYSWTGKTKNKSTELKLPFVQYSNIINLIFEVVQLADKNYSTLMNDKCLQCLLKHAREKLMNLQSKRAQQEAVNDSAMQFDDEEGPSQSLFIKEEQEDQNHQYSS